MMKFRKIPIVVNAIQWKGNNFKELSEFSHSENCILNQDGSLIIATLEGNMLVLKGDWIIEGINKELYPCKFYIFNKIYEKVSE